MLRSVSAGVLCLGLATLGIAVSRGEDPPKPDTEQVEILAEQVNLVVDESTPAKPETAATPRAENGKAGFTAKRGELVEIQIGNDDGLVGNGEKQGVQVRFDGGHAGDGIVIVNEDGKTTEQPRPSTTPRATRTVQYYTGLRQFPNPESREALEKLLAGLREEAKQLEKEGKAEEASQKTKTLQALEQLLKSQPLGFGGGGGAFFTEKGENSLELQMAADELKKAEQIRAKLTQRLKALTAESEQAAKIRQELQGHDEKIDSLRKQFDTKHAGGGTGVRYVQAPPGVQVMPGGGMSGMTRGMAGTGMITGGLAARWGGMAGGGRSKSAALAHQAEVLSQSAARLKEAGLDDQAKQLAEQAEKLRDQAATQAKREAELLAAQAHATGGTGGGVSFTGGPPADLHRSIQELQEQVQMLRKEVAEVREILQPKR